MRRLGIATIGLVAAASSGCASPCYDDGLDQGGCPVAATEPTAGTADETANTMTATETDTTAPTTDPTIGTGGNEMYTCPELDEVLLPQIPTFQLVVDRSGSMEEDFGGQSRWEAMKSTLIGDEGVVTQ